MPNTTAPSSYASSVKYGVSVMTVPYFRILSRYGKDFALASYETIPSTPSPGLLLLFSSHLVSSLPSTFRSRFSYIWKSLSVVKFFSLIVWIPTTEQTCVVLLAITHQRRTNQAPSIKGSLRWLA
jgi:hypothetical protein